MKKLIFIILFLISFSLPVSAAENDTALLLVTDCSVSENGLSAGEEATLYITIENCSTYADADACKLTFSEDAGDIAPVGTGTQYVAVLEAEDSYVWELPVVVAANAADGTHTATVRVSFTNPDGSEGFAEDALRLTVSNKSELEVGSIAVPGEITSGDMADFSFTVLNTGKSTLYGVTMTVSVDGAGTVGKDAVGDLRAGQSGSGNIRFSTSDFIVSARAGTVTFSGETADGETVSVSERYYFEIVSEETPEDTQSAFADRSQPRLMVASCIIEDDAISPGESKKVSVTIVNTHADKDVQNLKLSFRADGDELLCEGMGTQYLSTLDAGESYVWELQLQAAHTAKSGLHTATLGIEYEDEDGNAYSNTDTLRLAVRQTVLLVWDNLVFPETVIMGDTTSLSLTLQNMGGAAVNNVLVTFEADGLTGSGSVLVGTIEAGQSAPVNANFNVTAETPGEVRGVAKLRYQDDFGDNHAEDIPIVTKVIEKPAAPTEDEEKKQEQTANGVRHWWIFLLVGLVVGIGGSVGITVSVFNRKNRLTDEERL